jgi:gliding motility-associated-like protein
MKKFLLLAIALMAFKTGTAQIDCTIYPGDTTVCYGSRLYLYTGFADTLRYYWHHSGETSVIVEVKPYDTTVYKVTVTNIAGTVSCTDSVIVSTYPHMVIEFLQINKGCPDECKAQVQAQVSGGFPPYRPLWNADVAPNDSSLALGLCSNDDVIFLVFDTICLFDTIYTVEAYDLPDVEITYSPDSIYKINPQATFSFENKSNDTIPLTNWAWVFSDGTSTNELSPTHVFGLFEGKDTVLFTYTTIDGCIDTLLTEIELKDFKLAVPNVFTPNGDGVNDFFDIPDLEKYKSNEMIIFNRWGKKVYEKNNYDGTWDGGGLNDGVYFYILRCTVYGGEEVFQGSVSIFGSGN